VKLSFVAGISMFIIIIILVCEGGQGGDIGCMSGRKAVIWVVCGGSYGAYCLHEWAQSGHMGCVRGVRGGTRGV
jgi:uncharacterized membrane protein YdcZ (DUF606 family)